MRKNQNSRRNLDTSQRAMLAVDDEADYAVVAKERQGTRTDLEENIVANLPPSEDTGKAREHAARDWNVSARSVQDAKAVIGSKATNQKRTICCTPPQVLTAVSLADRALPWPLSRTPDIA
ncbi:MAG: hypothetical protein HQK57_03930 [Deltaproteobacteria bacterium]|nr:hypothetical protein [Deltaproteobacteria bacterium]